MYIDWEIPYVSWLLNHLNGYYLKTIYDHRPSLSPRKLCSVPKTIKIWICCPPNLTINWRTIVVDAVITHYNIIVCKETRFFFYLEREFDVSTFQSLIRHDTARWFGALAFSGTIFSPILRVAYPSVIVLIQFLNKIPQSSSKRYRRWIRDFKRPGIIENVASERYFYSILSPRCNIMFILNSSGGTNRRDSQKPTAIDPTRSKYTHLLYFLLKIQRPLLVHQITFYNTIITYYRKTKR